MSEYLPIILETTMIVAFGASWPLNVIKSYRSRTAKGKSLAFLLLVLFGYVAGITGKLIKGDFSSWLPILCFCFYILNFIMVSTDCILYFRNLRLDRKKQ